MYHGFYTSRGRKFPHGNFRTSVFCEVKTQIVGKTKFFDRLQGTACGQSLFLCPIGAYSSALEASDFFPFLPGLPITLSMYAGTS